MEEIEALFPAPVYSSMRRELFASTACWLYTLAASNRATLSTAVLALQLWQRYIALRQVPTVRLGAAAGIALNLATKQSDVTAFRLGQLTVKVRLPGLELRKLRKDMVLVLKGQLRPPTALDALTNAPPLAQNVALLYLCSTSKYYSFSASQLAQICLDLSVSLEKGALSTQQEAYYSDLQDCQRVLFSLPRRISSALIYQLESLFGFFKFDSTGLGIAPTSLPAFAEEQPKEKEEEVFQLKSLLGRGSYGKVWLVEKEGQEQAQKAQRINREALTELSILSTYKQKNVLELLSFSMTPSTLLLYMSVGESVANLYYGTTEEERGKGWYACYVEGILPKQKLTTQEKRLLQKDLLSGMAYLAFMGVMHRDVKIDNLLLVDGVLKIADFGMSLQMAFQPSKKEKKVYTLSNRPPEILYANDAYYGLPADVWATATVLLEMETNVTPFYYGLQDEAIVDWEKIKSTRPVKKKSGAHTPDQQIRRGKASTLWAMAKILGSPIQEPPYEKFPYDYPISDLAAVKDEHLKALLFQMLEWQPSDRITLQAAAKQFYG